MGTLKIYAYVDYGTCTELLAVFHDSKSYECCIDALEGRCKELAGVLVENTEMEKDDK